MLQRGIKFKFNQPNQPWAGGSWERLIRSVKELLYHVTESPTLSVDDLSTIFTEVETILNSRPIHAMSEDPTDHRILTPGHALANAPINPLPPGDFSQDDPPIRRRWRLVQRITDDFWKDFKASIYIPLEKVISGRMKRRILRKTTLF